MNYWFPITEQIIIIIVIEKHLQELNFALNQLKILII